MGAGEQVPTVCSQSPWPALGARGWLSVVSEARESLCPVVLLAWRGGHAGEGSAGADVKEDMFLSPI